MSGHTPATHLVGLDLLQQCLHVLNVLSAALQAVQLADRQGSLQTRQTHTQACPSSAGKLCKGCGFRSLGLGKGRPCARAVARAGTVQGAERHTQVCEALDQAFISVTAGLGIHLCDSGIRHSSL
eukprot:1159344-Pelagomonas_calceolata.AAC.5